MGHNPKDAAKREAIVKARSDQLRQGANGLVDTRFIFRQWEATIKGTVLGSFLVLGLLDELPRLAADPWLAVEVGRHAPGSPSPDKGRGPGR